MNRNDTQSLKQTLSALADNELGENEALTEAEAIELACRDRDAMLSWQCAHLTRDVLQADYTAALRPDFAALVSDRITQEESLLLDDYQTDSDRVVSMAAARKRSVRRPREMISGGINSDEMKPGLPNSGATRSTEQTVSLQNQPFRLWKPIAGLGLAASLAGATLLFSQLQTEQPDGSLVAEVPDTTGEVQPVASQQADVENTDSQTLQASVPMENRGTRWRMDSDLPRNKQIEQRLNTLLTNHLEDARMGRVTGMMSHSRVVGYDSVQGDQPVQDDQQGDQ